MALAIWTVYEHPTDYPGKYVARKFEVDRRGVVATREMMVRDTLTEVRREMIRRGLTRLMRDPRDEPQIVETWL